MYLYLDAYIYLNILLYNLVWISQVFTGSIVAPQLPRPIGTSVRIFVLVSAHSAHHIVITRVTIGWLQASATKWAYPDCVPLGLQAYIFALFVSLKAPLFAFFFFFFFMLLIFATCIAYHHMATIYIYISTHKASWKRTVLLIFLLFILSTKSRLKTAKGRQSFERVRFSDYTWAMWVLAPGFDISPHPALHIRLYPSMTDNAANACD
jgi:hypothetical protein